MVASGLIEYMDEDEKLIQELNRITSVNGILIINIVNSWGYATCLNNLTKYLKKIPGVMPILSKIRRAILSSEYGADDLGFAPENIIFGNSRNYAFRMASNLKIIIAIISPFFLLLLVH